MEALAGSPWSVVVFVAVALVATRLLDAGLGSRLPKGVLPWISMAVGMAGEVATALLAGLGWQAALLKGFAAGAGGAWAYSAGAKKLPGVRAGD